MDNIKDLVAIGFTEYEARVYMALLREHPATGYQLSKSAGVPRSMVYEALGRLHTRGAVLKSGDYRRALYRPLSPDALLDRYEQGQRRLLQNLRENLRRIHSEHSEDHLWSISGRDHVLAYAQQMIDSAEEELLLVLPDAHLLVLSDKIRSVCEAGIATRALLTGSGSLGCGNVIHHPPQESELQQLDDLLVVVVDGNECLISSGDVEMEATITNNRNLVLITRQFIWMEFFAQRIYQRLGQDLLEILEPEDRRLYGGMAPD